MLTLCEYVHRTMSTDIQDFGGRVPDTAGSVSIRLMPGVRGMSGGREARKRRWRHGRPRLMLYVRVAWRFWGRRSAAT